jgi:hypothetical protein
MVDLQDRSDQAYEEAPVNRPPCKKCGGRLVYESYPMEDLLVSKCFVCGKIDAYRELSRDQARKLFRRVDQTVAPPVAPPLAS